MTVDNFVRKKVAMWVDCVEKLSKAATKSPQAAYTALSKSLQCEWSYLQRVMFNCGDAFVPLQDAIFKAFYPAWSEGDLSDAECKLFSRFAGLEINKQHHHPTTLLPGTKVVVEAIKGCVEFSFACHLDASTGQGMSHEMHLKRLPNRNLIPFLQLFHQADSVQS